MFARVIRGLRIAIIITIITLGGCWQLLWHDHLTKIPDHCTELGTKRGLTDVRTLLEEGANSSGVCGGYRGDEFETFKSR